MDYREFHSALLSKGGAEEDRSGDHVFFYIDVDGQSYRATKFSHSASGQVTAPILSAISRQMRLTNRELRRFVDCTIERKGWLKLWRERGYKWPNA